MTEAETVLGRPEDEEPAAVQNDGALRLRFWTDFKRYMQTRSAIRCATPSVDGWMDHGADLNGGVLYSIMRTRLGEIGVQFALNDSTAATIYSWLQSNTADLEAALDDGLSWHDPEGAQTSLIEVRRSAELTDETLWPEYFEWLLVHLEAFKATLWPLVGRVPPPQDAAHRWDEDTFFDALKSLNPAGVVASRALLLWTAAAGFRTTWGRGRRFGSATPRIVCSGQPYEPISVWTSSVVVLRFVDLRKCPPWDKSDRRLQFLERLNRVPHFALPEKAVNQRLALPMQLLGEPPAMAAFADALSWFRDTSRAFRHR